MGLIPIVRFGVTVLFSRDGVRRVAACAQIRFRTASTSHAGEPRNLCHKSVTRDTSCASFRLFASMSEYMADVCRMASARSSISLHMCLLE